MKKKLFFALIILLSFSCEETPDTHCYECRELLTVHFIDPALSSLDMEEVTLDSFIVCDVDQYYIEILQDSFLIDTLIPKKYYRLDMNTGWLQQITVDTPEIACHKLVELDCIITNKETNEDN
jgi:hypothetical protein